MDRHEPLATRAIAGDREALVAIVDAEQQHLRNVAARYVGRADDVDEVLQDVVLRGIERVSTVRDPDRLVPWLAAVTRHAAIDHVRRARREAPTDLDGLDHHDQVQSSFTDDVVTRDFVHTALAQLAPRDREALVLRDGYDLGVDEVADRLSLTNGSARVMLVRARKRFAAVARAAAAAVLATFGPRLRRFLDDTHGGAVMTSGATAVVVAAVAVGPISTAQAAPPAALYDPAATPVAASASADGASYLVALAELEDGRLGVDSVEVLRWATPTEGHRPAGVTSLAAPIENLSALAAVPEEVEAVRSEPDVTVVVGDEDGDHVRVDIDIPDGHEGTPLESLPIDEILEALPRELRVDPASAVPFLVD